MNKCWELNAFSYLHRRKKKKIWNTFFSSEDKRKHIRYVSSKFALASFSLGLCIQHILLMLYCGSEMSKLFSSSFTSKLSYIRVTSAFLSAEQCFNNTGQGSVTTVHSQTADNRKYLRLNLSVERGGYLTVGWGGGIQGPHF